MRHLVAEMAYKKRRGSIRIEWQSGKVTQQPIDPDQMAIPDCGWIGPDDQIEWMERPQDAEAVAEWYKMQDELDTVASHANGLKGGRPAGFHDDALQLALTMKRRNEALSAPEIARRLIDRGESELSEDRLTKLIRQAIKKVKTG